MLMHQLSELKGNAVFADELQIRDQGLEFSRHGQCLRRFALQSLTHAFDGRLPLLTNVFRRAVCHKPLCVVV